MATEETSQRFRSMYEGCAPWDIPAPQPALVGVEAAGEIEGPVLDAGCGTGENAMFLASKGHEVLGVDFTPLAIERAIAKASERGSSARFQVGDALELASLGQSFGTVIDCGLFHTFTDEQRPRYVAGLEAVVRPGGRVHILCFSDQEPPGQGPRRVSKQELRDAFAVGWEVVRIDEARFQTNDTPETRTFTPGGPRGWLATMRRQVSTP